MSLISKALKKAQETKQNLQEGKPKNIVYLSDAPQSWPRTGLMCLWIASTLIAIFISLAAINMTIKNTESKQVQVAGLEKTIKAQEKRINGLLASINKSNKYSDSQMRDMKLRLKNVNKDVDLQIGKLASNSKDNYASLKEALLSEQQEITFMDNYIKKLNQKIESISVANNQVKDVVSPVIGN